MPKRNHPPKYPTSQQRYIHVDKNTVIPKGIFNDSMKLLGIFQEDLKQILTAILIHKETMITSGNVRDEDLQLYQKCEEVALRQSNASIK